MNRRNLFFTIIGVVILAIACLLMMRQQKKDFNKKKGKESKSLTKTNVEYKTESNTEDDFRRILKEAYNRIKPLYMQGKCVDTYGRLLPGVEVLIRWSTAETMLGLPEKHNQHRWITSDSTGEWRFEIHKPSLAGVYEAKKDGYAFEKSKSTMDELMRVRSKNNTDSVDVVVCMRKKKEEVWLLSSPNHGHGEILLTTKMGKPARASIDIFDKVIYTIEKQVPREDVQVEACFDASNKVWVISFLAAEGTDTLLVSDEKLYEAPESGYAKKAEIRMPADLKCQDKEAFIYLQSRSPAVYSRINLKVWVGSGDEKYGGQELSIQKQSFTNPYGERSLENGERFEKYTFARDELVQEAKKAIQSGTLPKKPENLEAYLEEREKVIRKAKNIPMR